MASKSKSNSKLTARGKVWRLVACIAVPLGGGFLISLLTRDAMGQLGTLNQPPLTPPAWLFPVAWTILYILMGVASYLIYLKIRQGEKTENSSARIALIIYGTQLVFNFLWTPLFFNANLYWLAFVVLLIMWILELVLLIKAYKISRPAFCCLLPYIIWSTFAAYLNISIALLN